MEIVRHLLRRPDGQPAVRRVVGDDCVGLREGMGHADELETLARDVRRSGHGLVHVAELLVDPLVNVRAVLAMGMNRIRGLAEGLVDGQDGR